MIYLSILGQSGRFFFQEFDVTATNYIYNEALGTSTDSGALSARADHCLVQIGLDDLSASSVSYRIEGRNLSVNRWCDVYSQTLTAPLSVDKIINITEAFHDIRVAVKTSGEATPNKFTAAILLTEVK